MRAQADSHNIEGDHLSSTCGRVVCNRKGDVPYTVILTREAGETSEHGFSTMQEAEAFIILGHSLAEATEELPHVELSRQVLSLVHPTAPGVRR